MDSVHYEELCRRYIADKFSVPIESVESRREANPRRADEDEFDHQIDLWWETGGEAVCYVNIANAKWRGTEKVDQPDVMLLNQVRQSVNAHKALMLTSVGFTEGAVRVAQHHGIGLHIVRAHFSEASLPATKDRPAIQAALTALVAGRQQQLYTSEICLRGLEFPTGEPAASPSLARPVHQVGGGFAPSRPSVQTATPAPPMNRGPAAISSTNRMVGGGMPRGAGFTRGGGGGPRGRG